MTKQMTSQTTREVKNLFKRLDTTDTVAMDETLSSQSRIVINALKKKFKSFFETAARAEAVKIVNEVDNNATKTTDISLKQISSALEIAPQTISTARKEIIKTAINANVSLIKSIQARYFEQIEEAIHRSILEGRGIQFIIDELLKREGITIRRAKLIALDQTKKVYAALSAERAQAVGITEFEWLHSGAGKEPRPHHQFTLDGKIYSYKNPPVIDLNTGQRGLPAQLINCRCKARPILRLKKDEE